MSRYKLFLGHLSPDARTRDVERFFKDHGFSKSIVEVVVKTGYGFVVRENQLLADNLHCFFILLKSIYSAAHYIISFQSILLFT